MIVSKENVANLFVEKMYYNPFHVNTQMEDAYYEASHSGAVMPNILFQYDF